MNHMEITQSSISGMDYTLTEGTRIIECYTKKDILRKYCSGVLTILEGRGGPYKIDECHACIQQCTKVLSLSGHN